MRSWACPAGARTQKLLVKLSSRCLQAWTIPGSTVCGDTRQHSTRQHLELPENLVSLSMFGLCRMHLDDVVLRTCCFMKRWSFHP